jgi:hypothetical protein
MLSRFLPPKAEVAQNDPCSNAWSSRACHRSATTISGCRPALTQLGGSYLPEARGWTAEGCRQWQSQMDGSGPALAGAQNPAFMSLVRCPTSTNALYRYRVQRCGPGQIPDTRFRLSPSRTRR